LKFAHHPIAQASQKAITLERPNVYATLRSHESNAHV
jgi:hypothetical protein